MCFSASASFGAGIVLSGIGIASIKKAQNPSQIIFGAIPFIFCIQQITEGFLWLALSNPGFAFLQNFTTYTFLFFAQVIWPFYVPLSILLLEKKSNNNTLHKVLLAIGILVSLYLSFCLVSFKVNAEIIGRHITYHQNYPEALSEYGGGLYLIATILPPFISRKKYMWVLGTAILISYIITNIFYSELVVSVWCFFASIISITVFAILHVIKQSTDKSFTNGDSGIAYC